MKKLILPLVFSLLLGACTVPSFLNQNNSTTNSSGTKTLRQDLLDQVDATTDDAGASDLQQLDTEAQEL